MKETLAEDTTLKKLKIAEQGKKISEKWSKLSKSQKQVYKKKFNDRKAEQENQNRLKIKAQLKYGLNLSAGGIKKKKPHQPFTLYCKEKMGDFRALHPGKTYHECLKLIGAVWRGLPETEKSKFKAK